MAASRHIAGHRSDLVKGGGIGDDTVAGDAAVGRFQPDAAAVGGRLADGAAGIGAEGGDCLRAAMAAAEPPEEPPGMHSRFQGLRVTPKALPSQDEPMANSSWFSLPSSTAPRSCSFSQEVASYGGMKSARIFEAQVVLTPLVRKISFSASGNTGKDIHLARGDATVSRCRRLQRLFTGYGDKGVHPFVGRFDARQAGPGSLNRRDFFLLQLVVQFVDGQIKKFHYVNLQ